MDISPSESYFATGSAGMVPSMPLQAGDSGPNSSTATDFGIEHEPMMSEGSSLKPKTSLFTTGLGTSVAPPSRQAVGAMQDLFDDVIVYHRVQDAELLPRDGRFQIASGASALPPSKSSIAQAMAIFRDDDPHGGKEIVEAGLSRSQPLLGCPGDIGESSSTASIFRPPTSSAPPRRANRFARPYSPASFSSPRPLRESLPSIPPRPSTPSRPPLQTTKNTFAHREENPTRQNVKLPKAIEIRTPAPMRRIGLGSSNTPGSTKSKGGKSFVTPFSKNLGRAKGTPDHLAIQGGPARSLPQTVTKAVFEPVFDLTRKCHLAVLLDLADQIRSSKRSRESTSSSASSAVEQHWRASGAGDVSRREMESTNSRSVLTNFGTLTSTMQSTTTSSQETVRNLIT